MKRNKIGFAAFFLLFLFSMLQAIPIAHKATFTLLEPNGIIAKGEYYASIISCSLEEKLPGGSENYFDYQNPVKIRIPKICGKDYLNATVMPCEANVCRITTNSYSGVVNFVVYEKMTGKILVSYPFTIGQDSKYQVEISNSENLKIKNITPILEELSGIFTAIFYILIIGLMLFLVKTALGNIRKNLALALVCLIMSALIVLYFAFLILRS